MKKAQEKKAKRHIYSTGAAGCGGKAAPTNAKNTGQPLPCPLCERVFKQDGRLKDHIKSQHSQADADAAAAPGNAATDRPSGGETTGGGSGQGVGGGDGEKGGGVYYVKTPKVLLNEWCQKNKRPTPKYKHVEAPGGGFHARVIMPDARDPAQDSILWWRGTPAAPSSLDAHNRAATMALHHVMGSTRLDRVLGEAFRQQWKELDREADDRRERDRRHAEDRQRREERERAQQQRQPQRANVFLSDDKRHLVHALLSTTPPPPPLSALPAPFAPTAATTPQGGLPHGTAHAADASAPPQAAPQGAAAAGSSGSGSASSHQAVAHQLLAAGFPLDWTQQATAHCSDYVAARDWLILHMPEHLLPAQFAASSSAAAVAVLHAAAPSALPSSSALHLDQWQPSISPPLRWLMACGYDGPSALHALSLTAHGGADDQVAALAWLQKQFPVDVHGTEGPGGGEGQGDGEWGGGEQQGEGEVEEAREEERMVLEAIYGPDLTVRHVQGAHGMAVVMSVRIKQEAGDGHDGDGQGRGEDSSRPRAAALHLEVIIPVTSSYPFSLPLLAFRLSSPTPIPLPPSLPLSLRVWSASALHYACHSLPPGMGVVHSLATWAADHALPTFLALLAPRPASSGPSPPSMALPHLAALSLAPSSSASASAPLPAPAVPAPALATAANPTAVAAAVVGSGGSEVRAAGDDAWWQQGAAGGKAGRGGRRAMGDGEAREDWERLKRRWEEMQGSRQHAGMLHTRRGLPVASSRAQVLAALQQSWVVVVSGATGSGKSTQVPQYILEGALEQPAPTSPSSPVPCCSVVITQPRRISAVGLAHRVAQERAETVGDTVGYAIRMEARRSLRTRLLFCTTGLLLRRLLGDPLLAGVSHVVVDEVHERSLDSDLLLLLLRFALLQRNVAPQPPGQEKLPLLRIVLMSATADAHSFADYFHRLLLSHSHHFPPSLLSPLQPTSSTPSPPLSSLLASRLPRPALISVPGRTHPVRQLFLEDALALTNTAIGRNSKYARKGGSKGGVGGTASGQGMGKEAGRGVDGGEGGEGEKARDMDGGQDEEEEAGGWEALADDASDGIGSSNGSTSKLLSASTLGIAQQSVGARVVDESVINYELVEALIAAIMRANTPQGHHHHQQLLPAPSAASSDSSSTFSCDSSSSSGSSSVSSLLLVPEPAEGGAGASAGAVKARGVLVFLPGMAEIKHMQRHLEGSRLLQQAVGEGGARGRGGMVVVPLHGSLAQKEQQRVFAPVPEGTWKVVLSTNVAETSVTIDDVVWVVDSGRQREVVHDVVRGMDVMGDAWVSHAAAAQRAGRAGRVQPGCCIRLYSRSLFHSLPPHTPPEMLRVSLDSLCLQVKAMLPTMPVAQCLSLALTPPPPSAISSSLSSLVSLSALHMPSEALSPLGAHLARLPLDVHVGKMLLFSVLLRCLDPALSIAAAAAHARPLFLASPVHRDVSSQAKARFAGATRSDHVAVAVAYQGWADARGGGRGGEWAYCEANGLSRDTLVAMEGLRRDFVLSLASLGFLPASYVSAWMDKDKGTRHAHVEGAGGRGGEGQRWNVFNENSQSWRVVKGVICAGFYPNVVRVQRPEKRFVKTEHGAVERDAAARAVRFYTRADGRVFLHPGSVNFSQGTFESPWLVFSEKIQTSKIFIRECSMAPAFALLLLGGLLNVNAERRLVAVDNWIQFEAPGRIGILVREMRSRVDEVLRDKMARPDMDLGSHPVLEGMAELLSSEGF
ncbi:hypothetical protein CLOM_g17337 [Closterium sp. NIES-68]|nr:hypothetical protein CLOM_g17337 [Closterium sp. NIES-68]